MLLWAWLLSAYGFVLRMRHKVDVRLSAFASTILAGIQVFFLLLLNFAAPPFAIQPGPVAQDGFGLNPLLQYPEMVIHPPMLYLGYVGFSVPFAFALGCADDALSRREVDPHHAPLDHGDVAISDLWNLPGRALGVQRSGLGRLLGMGPGGKCLPDAMADGHGLSALGDDAGEARHDEDVERLANLLDVPADDSRNAVDALGHRVERPCIRAVFDIGDWFYGFILIVFGVCLFTFFKQKDHLKSENKLESLVSRESSFLFNNLILLVACFTVLWGTLFPVLSEYVQGSKVTVGAPFYNRVNIPIGLVPAVPDRHWTAAGVAFNVTCARSAGTSFCPASRWQWRLSS